MFMEAIHQKYAEYSDVKNKVMAMGDNCPQEMNNALNKMLIALVFLVLAFLVLFMIALYYAFKCAIVQRWGAYVPILLIIAMMMPNIGGFVMIGLIVYGALNCGSICDVPGSFKRALV
jgi:hypothetical protein